MAKIDGSSNVLDLLLNADIDINKKPTKEVEVKRLSELFGSAFVLKCTALSPDKIDSIQNGALKIDKNGKDFDLDVTEVQVFTVIAGVIGEDGKPLFKNKEILKKFNCPTPKELVNRLLLSGERSTIYSVISDLSGYGENAVKEIKN